MSFAIDRQAARRAPALLQGAGRHLPSLLASLAPGAAFGAGVLVLRGTERFAWLGRPSSCPWELWTIAGAGTIATAAGIGDWLYHRLSGCAVGPIERRWELAALAGGGLPLFALMTAATLMDRPAALLLPILGVLLFTVVLICYDEFVFHRRRCGRLETALHRGLVFGHAIAFGAWLHFCFVRGGFHG